MRFYPFQACFAYLFCTILHRLLHQMHDIRRTEFAQRREAVGPDLNYRVCIVFVQSVGPSVCAGLVES